jgi:hypothetical protein
MSTTLRAAFSSWRAGFEAKSRKEHWSLYNVKEMHFHSCAVLTDARSKIRTDKWTFWSGPRGGGLCDDSCSVRGDAPSSIAPFHTPDLIPTRYSADDVGLSNQLVKLYQALAFFFHVVIAVIVPCLHATDAMGLQPSSEL